jgi:hypothetical protein
LFVFVRVWCTREEAGAGLEGEEAGLTGSRCTGRQADVPQDRSDEAAQQIAGPQGRGRPAMITFGGGGGQGQDDDQRSSM